MTPGDRPAVNGSRTAGALLAIATLVLAVLWYLQLWPWAPTKPLPSPSVRSYSDVSRLAFTSFTTGWVEVIRSPGKTVALYSTADAGRTWKLAANPGPDPDRFFDLQALDSHHLIATTGLPDGLWWSSDGGKTWEKRSPSALSPDVLPRRSRLGQFFLDARHGWLLDFPSDPAQAYQPRVLWATSDGGITWNEVWRLDPRSPEFAEMVREQVGVLLSFRDVTTGFLGIRLLHETRLYRTDDGGHAWRPLVLPLSKPPLLIIQLAHTRDGAAILTTSDGFGLPAMAVTSRDGGDDWEAPRQLPDPPGGIPGRIDFLDHDHWRSVSLQGGLVFVTNDAGRTWTGFEPSVPQKHRLQTATWFADRLHAWANAGDLLLRSEDGGHSWTPAGPP